MKELLSKLLSRENIRCQQSKAGQAGLYLNSGTLKVPVQPPASTKQTNSSTHSSTQKQSSAAGETHPEAPQRAVSL